VDPDFFSLGSLRNASVPVVIIIGGGGGGGPKPEVTKGGGDDGLGTTNVPWRPCQCK